MSRYDTNNPIDSDDYRDGSDNLKTLDQVVNSSEETVLNRFGVARPTLAGVEARINEIHSSLSAGVLTELIESLGATESEKQSFADSMGLVKKIPNPISGYDEIVRPVLVRPSLSRVHQSGLYNCEYLAMPRWQAALSRHRAGYAAARIACIGDSTTSGVGSNPSSASADGRRRAYPAALAAAINNAGIAKAQANSVFCDGFEGSNLPTFEPRLTLGASWSVHPTLFCLGGNALWDAPAASSTPLVWEPTEATDTLDVYYIRYPGYAEFVVADDATYVGSQSTAGTTGVAKATFTRTLSTNPWAIQKSNFTLGADLMIVGIDAYSSAGNSIAVFNMGASGSRVSHWTNDNQAYSFVNAIQVVSPDLSIINLTINDWAQKTDLALYEARQRIMIEACAVSGDVMLVVGVPSNTETATAEEQAAYASVVHALAEEYDLPAVNFIDRWVSQAYRPDRGYYFDGQHPSATGYQDVAYTFMRAVFGL